MLKKILIAIPTLAICAWMAPSANACVVNIGDDVIVFPLQGTVPDPGAIPTAASFCQFSANGQFFFDWQSDGNLVQYQVGVTPARWASKTNGSGTVLNFQTDGNLVIYNANGKPLWASNTKGDNDGNEILKTQNDGNSVVSEDGVPKWDTVHHPVP